MRNVLSYLFFWSRADQVLVLHQLHHHFVTMLEGILGTLSVQFLTSCQQIYFKSEQIILIYGVLVNFTDVKKIGKKR